MDKKAAKRWDRLNEAFRYLAEYIESKKDRYQLTEVDLALVSNFKGGNASITEPLERLHIKLQVYGGRLRELGARYEGRSLSSLNDGDLSVLQEDARAFVQLPFDPGTRIRGFKSSYASGLLAAYFPDLLPVLDRRIVGALNKTAPLKHPVEWTDKKKSQVREIEKHYPCVIERFHARLRSEGHRSLRELDKELFSEFLALD